MLSAVLKIRNIVHVDGSIDPLRDIETINLELIFSDVEILETAVLQRPHVVRTMIRNLPKKWK